MKTFIRRFSTGDFDIIYILAILKLLLHLFSNTQYGFHRDELYYLACANHLDLGYVDHPPFIAFLAAFIKPLFGTSLFAIRLLPSLASASIVYLAGLSVRRLGGGKFACALGCLAVIIAPLFLSMGVMFTTNVFDQLFWMLAAYLLIVILKNSYPRYWLFLGLLIGLGLLNKHTMIIYTGAILIALALTPYRKYYANKYFWGCILIAGMVFLPNIIWQANHGWPTIEFLHEAAINRMEQVSPLGFLGQQFFSLNPVNIVLLIAGLYFYFFYFDGKPYRLFGIVFLLVFAFFAFQRSKDYYLAPAYPIIWAGGAIFLEKLANNKWRVLKPGLIVLMILAGIIVAPFSLPILSFDKLEKLADIEKTEFPPVFRDMIGWENMVASVAKDYNVLPDKQKAVCAILANNYGEAAAIDYYGSKYGLPKAICAHNSYWLWGPRDYTGELILSVGLNHEDLGQGFGEVKKLREIANNQATWYESNLSILLWSKPKLPLNKMWPFIKMYY
jgi:hypothetical protein